MKILFNDTETTGLSCLKQDVIQIGAIISNNFKKIEEVNLRCQPINWDEISQQALDCNHVTRDMLKTYEDPKKVWQLFSDILEEHFDKKDPYLFAGQNTPFDRRFMNAWWDKNKISSAPSFEYYLKPNISLDLQNISKEFKYHNLLKLENVKLGTVMESLGIKPDGDLHDALTDIKGTANAIYKLINRLKRLKKDQPKHPVFHKIPLWMLDL
jgi:DNA polymerase III alpha subunit (gram-positive type)